jgi:hypothetical protein
MNAEWRFAPLVATSVVSGGVALTFLAGAGGVYRALTARPAPLLRNE